MSTLLYSIGRWATGARRLVLMLWIVLLALLGTSAALFGQGANAPITIPGTESQDALTELGRTFPEVSGTSATLIIVAPEGQRVDEAPYEAVIESASAQLEDFDAVTAVQSPFSELASGGLSDDGRAALVTVQIEGEMSAVPDEVVDGIVEATDELRTELPDGTEVSYGGEIFSAAIPGVSPTEAIGVVIAFIVLVLTLGSLIAAGMPLLIAIIGVGVSIAGLFVVTAFVDLTSTTPMLALMLGLAVGIDYTLFIVSRHQEQLRAGVEMRESIARATATSGSAVVFAGLTVIIALVGLSVAGIPFLTALGVAAAAAVAVAVVISVTLTPAIMAMAGWRILPKKQRPAEALGFDSSQAPRRAGEPVPPAPRAKRVETKEPTPSRADRFFAAWVRGATRRPVLTIVAVLVALGIAAVPALDLRLALPNATSLAQDDPARVTYELTGEHFGDGSNGPLLLTGSIVASDDPLGLLDDLKAEIEQVEGVAEVPLATPNQTADTAIIQVVPEEGPHAESTTELVHELRAHHDEWAEQYGVSLAVTGFTAVAIDVSEKLMLALLPFGVLVVGLSLVLLAMVFRSLWVPLKATLGYLLSVGVSFGAVVAVFQWGWLADALHVPSTGPVLSFLPIILMGVLFGLAMDYEVFLVSRMREEYVHGANARDAISRGFAGSAKVVTAAALIMFAVFAAFVPEGDPSIKVIALGLAVGVFVDAFIVRMTLVPAVMALLGDRAWSMPRWAARLLPSFDVEGEGLARELAHAEWPADMPDAAIAADHLGVMVPGGEIRVADRLRVAPGDVLWLDPRDSLSLPLSRALMGRGAIRVPPAPGAKRVETKEPTVKVNGLLLPERAASLRKRSAWAEPATLREVLRDRPSLLLLDLRGDAAQPLTYDEMDGVRSALAAADVESERGSAPRLTIMMLGDRALAEQLTPPGAALVSATADTLTTNGVTR